MTNKQLFSAFGGVKEKYLAEMLDDEPQRAIELRPVKRSPVKFTAIVTAACLAFAGIAAGAVFVGKRGGISALLSGFSTEQGNTAAEKYSVSLDNITLNDDWLQRYPDDYLDSLISEYLLAGYDAPLDGFPSNLEEFTKRYTDRDTGYDYTPVTANLKLSFSAWDKLPSERVMAQVQFFADGEPIKYIPLKDPYYYNPAYERDEEFDPLGLIYGDMGYFTLDKARAENAASDTEKKIYEFPLTFDVKKGTHQITAAVEFLSIEPGYVSHFESYSEFVTRTYLIDEAAEPPSKAYTFDANTIPGRFASETGSSESGTTIYVDNGVLTFGIDKSSSKKSFYLMVIMDGEPINCFDGKYSLTVDPKETKNGFTYKIPEEFIYEGYTSTLRLLAIPVVDRKFNGVYAEPITPRCFVTVNY